MFYEIYLDLIFLINLGMDILILLLAAKILKFNIKILRIVLAAVLGATWVCVISIYPISNNLIEGIITYIGISGLMVFVGFNVQKPIKILKGIGILYLVTFFMGGVIHFLYDYTQIGYYIRTVLTGNYYKKINLTSFVIVSLIAFITLQLMIRLFKYFKNNDKNIYDVELMINGKIKKTIGLLDTGNSLIEPITRKPVVIAEYSLIEEMLPEGIKKLIYGYLCNNTINYDDLEDEFASKIKLIPFHSIGEKNGVLIGLIIEGLIINLGDNILKAEDVVIALYNYNLSSSNKYHVILNPKLMDAI